MPRCFVPLFYFIFIFHCVSFSQEYGGNEPSHKWRQINTDSVRVIFPIGLEQQGQRLANTVAYLNRFSRRSIGDQERKIDIVLQNQTMVSNGYVGLAPFRSEFYTTAPQQGAMVGTNWLDLLSIHEYRHVLQVANSRVGITKGVYYLTGELGWSTLKSLSIPNWFSEGDAVVLETALSAQGRGRIPSFYNGYRSLTLNDHLYGYQKARNGSIKDYVPNHYEFGYLLCEYGRNNYGNDFWKDVIRDSGRYKGLFYPFSQSVKRRTGHGMKDFYKAAFIQYEDTWSDELNALSVTEADQVNSLTKGRTFTSYKHPYFVKNGSLLVYKESYKKIGGIYRINANGDEDLVKNIGLRLDNYFTVRNDKILWTEMGFHERWTWKNFSNVMMYDLQSKKKTKLTSKEKYLSPDLSHDGTKIAVFHASEDLKYAIHIIDAMNGSLSKALPNPENYYYAYPKWTADDREIIAVARNTTGQSAIVQIDVENGALVALTPYTNHIIGIPYITKNYVFFSASYSGIDNIYALKYGDQNIYQVSSRPMGGYHVSADKGENQVVFSEFTTLGNNIVRMKLNPDEWTIIDPVEPVEMEKYQSVSIEAEGGDIIEKIPHLEYKTSKYSQSSRLINIYSWSFFFNDPEYEFALFSKNILNTFIGEAGIRYNRNLDNFTYFVDFAYAQLYPVLGFSTNIRPRENLEFYLGVDEEGNVVDTITAKRDYWEFELKPGVQFPFRLSSGVYSRNLSFFTNYMHTLVRRQKLTSIDPAGLDLSSIPLSNYNRKSLEYGLTFSNNRLRARQNIFPKFSQFIYLRYRQSVDKFDNQQLYFDSDWTFPGLSTTHNIVIQASYQDENRNDEYTYVDNFLYPRGYGRPYYFSAEGFPFAYDHVYKIGFNYHLPLVYPDLGIAGLIYFYRIRMNAFFDFSRSHYSIESGDEVLANNSIGGELIFDTQILNYFSFTFGLRYSHLLNQDSLDPGRKDYFEFFVPLKRF